MTRHDPIAERVLRLAEPVCLAAGYDLVDVRFTMEPGGWVLRVYLDKPDGITQVDLDDCERMSRELSAVLDVEDPIPHAYSLEVSSPGLDRPLRTAAHFRRHVGAEVKISMAVPVPVPSGERRNFKGKLLGVEGDTEVDAAAVVEIDGKDTFHLRLRDVEQARLVPDWDAVLHKGDGHKKQKQKN
jgi:ribosome maturation factor RimP